MPIREHACKDEACRLHGRVLEAYYAQSQDIDPACSGCGATMERLVSRFTPAWCRDLSYYHDRSKEYAQADGHFGYRKDGTRTWIDSRQKQKAFCKSEGLVDPVDQPSNAVYDGTKFSGRGLKGQEI